MGKGYKICYTRHRRFMPGGIVTGLNYCIHCGHGDAHECSPRQRIDGSDPILVIRTFHCTKCGFVIAVGIIRGMRALFISSDLVEWCDRQNDINNDKAGLGGPGWNWDVLTGVSAHAGGVTHI